MTLLARIVGVLLVLFALVGTAATWAAQGMQMSTPVLERAAWTGPLRANVDWAIYALLALGGVQLARLHPARLLLGLALATCMARLAFDLVAADRTTARGQTILNGDVIVLAAAALGFGLACFVAGQRSARDRRT